MLNTYIKNRGTTQTIIHNNNQNHFNEINWDSDYDGNVANISVNSINDGKRNQLNFTFDNEDLANLFNVPSINVPIHKRLQMDFQDNINQSPLMIEIPDKKYDTAVSLIDQKISSLLPNEELIIPLTIDRKTTDKYTLTPRRKHKRRKTHVTHKVYKKHKKSSKSKKTKTHRKDTPYYVELL
jgi:hypothetical protein